MSHWVNVFIVDDHKVVRKGLRMFLEGEKEIKVCGEAENLNEALELINKNNPDIVLLDYKLPDGDGVTGCLKIKRMCPNTKVIILTAYTNEDIKLDALRSGADAYLLKDVESEQLISMILSLSREKVNMNSTRMKAVDRRSGNDFSLTDNEIIILNLISLGKVNKEIAEHLHVSEKTIRNYIYNVFKKINVSNRTEAAIFWVRYQKVNM